MEQFYKKSGRKVGKLRLLQRRPVGFLPESEEQRRINRRRGWIESGNKEWEQRTGKKEEIRDTSTSVSNESKRLMLTLKSICAPGKSNLVMASSSDKFGLGYGDYKYSRILSYENEVSQSVFKSNKSDFENPPLHKACYDSNIHMVRKDLNQCESEFQTTELDTVNSNFSTEPSELVSEPVIMNLNIEVSPKRWSDAPIIEELNQIVKEVSTVGGKRDNAVKSSAGCKWRTPGYNNNILSKCNGGSSLRNYSNFQRSLGRIKPNRHMTGKQGLPFDFQDFNGGLLPLEHFNLFSVSQMCDKKNKVLFTDSECLVLSPEFKLPDENQILLKVPRQNNMYSFNLENIVPTGGLACLIAKATTDESNKWHRRLGHVNFKTEKDIVKGNLPLWHPILPKPHTASIQILREESRAEEQAGAAKSSSTNIFSTSGTNLVNTVSTTAKASGTNFVNTVSVPVSTASTKEGQSDTSNSHEDDSEILQLEDIHEDTTDGIFTHSSYDDEGAEADFTNLETVVNVSPIPTSRINPSHPSALILGDPTSTVQTRSKVNKSSEAHSKTKHIAIRHHFIRDAYEKKLIQVLKIHTNDNVADLLTKAFDVKLVSMVDDEGRSRVTKKSFEGAKEQVEGTEEKNEGTEEIFESTEEQRESTEEKVESTAGQIEGTEDQTKEENATQASQTSTQTPTSMIFGDDETIATLLLNMSQAKAASKEKEKGVELKDVEEIDRPRPTSTRSLLTLKPLPKIDPKDKGKKKIEEEDESESEDDDIPQAVKKFKQLESDEVMARKIQEEWEAEEERNRIAEEEATNEALIKNFDDIKARIEADRILAEKLQEQEREQFTIEERAKFLHDTIAAQRKFLARQRSEAIRNRPPTKNQLRNQMMTYLKHVGNFKHSELKSKKFEDIQAMYEKIKRSDEDFIAIGSVEDDRLIKRMNKKDSSKGEEIKQESKEEVKEEDKGEENTRKRKHGTRKKMKSRKRRFKQDTSQDDPSDIEKENDELRLCLTIAPDEDKEVDYEILDKKYPIIDWKTENLGTKPQFDESKRSEEINMNVVTRSNGQKRSFSTLIRVLSVFDREDLDAVYKLVMDIYQDKIPEGFDKVLWGDLIVMFNPDEQDEFWNSQHEWKVVSWKLHSSSGVHTLMTDEGLVVHMLIEKKYPLKKEILMQMLKLKLESEEESTMALELIRFIKKSWLVQDQTVLGKDYSNLLIADSLLKTIWFINAPCYDNEALASPNTNDEELSIPEQTATGKGTSNPLMAGSLPKTTKPT
ncbi:hypothetical protein Tco_1338299 [Tanacetum coccineum]